MVGLNIVLVLFTIIGQVRLSIREANRQMHKRRITNVDITNPLMSHIEDNIVYER